MWLILTHTYQCFDTFYTYLRVWHHLSQGILNIVILARQIWFKDFQIFTLESWDWNDINLLKCAKTIELHFPVPITKHINKTIKCEALILWIFKKSLSISRCVMWLCPCLPRSALSQVSELVTAKSGYNYTNSNTANTLLYC